MIAEYLDAVDRGEPPPHEAVLAAHPEIREELEEFFADQESARRLARVSQESLASFLAPGSVIANHEILEELARGGMGVVYRARERKLGRVVALKVILAGPLASRGESERFLREAQAAAALDHPNIVPIYAVGEEGGRHFFTMRLIEGGSLATWSPPGGRTPRRAAELIETVARAVHHAHEHGTLHRDLKPSNVLLDAEGRPYLSDFGLARPLEGSSQLTASGDLLGTASYMAPEQSRISSDALTRAADVYSLGAVLYELLAGGPPFRGATAVETLRQAQESEPARPSILNRLVSADLETIVLKCLEKNPERRYVTALQLADDLKRFLSGEAIAARPISRVERGRRWCRRHATLSVAVFLITALAIGSLVAAVAIARLRSDTLDRLAEARLAEARARALGGAMGGRLRGLEAIREAATVRKDMALRSAAALCLSLPDVEPVAQLSSVEAGARCHALDPVHSRAAEGYESGAVIVRELPGGRQLARFDGAGASVKGLVFSPDSRLLVRSTGDRFQAGTLTLWDWERAAAPLMERDGVMSHRPCFDPVGQILAHGTADGHVRGTDVTTGKELWSYAIGDAADGVQFDPGGRRLALVTVTGRALVLDLVTGARTFEQPGQLVAWHPWGDLLGVADGAQVGLWDLRADRRVSLLQGSTGELQHLTFHPSGDTILTEGWDDTLRLWSLIGTEQVRMGGSIRDPSFRRDGGALGFQGADGSIRLSRFEPGTEVTGIYCGTNALGDLAFDSQDRFLAVSHPDGLNVLDAASGRIAARIGGGRVHSVLLRPDGKTAITVGPGGIHAWPLQWESGDSRDLLVSGPPRALFAKGTPDIQAALSADGRFVLLRLNIQWAQLIDLEEPGKPPVRFEHPGLVWCAVSPGGKWVATGPLHGSEARVWDAATRAVVKSYTLRRHVMSAQVGFSPDGRWFILSTGEGVSQFRVGEWDEPVRRFPSDEMTDLGRPFAFSPDGGLLALTLSPGLVRLGDAETGRELVTLETPRGKGFSRILFSPRGDRLLGTYSGGVVQVWDIFRLRARLRALGLDWDGPPGDTPPRGEQRPFDVKVVGLERLTGAKDR